MATLGAGQTSFEREAKTISQLNHPLISRSLFAGCSAAGADFFERTYTSARPDSSDSQAIHFPSGENMPLGSWAATSGPSPRTSLTGGDRNVQILSASAGLILFQTGATEKGTFTWFDRNGKRGDTIGAPDDYTDPGFGAHESKVVVQHAPSKALREVGVVTGRTSRLTSLNENYESAAASPDGSRVFCVAIVDAKPALVEILIGKQRRILGHFKKAKYPDYFESTGETLLLEGEREDGRGDFDLYLATRRSDFQVVPLLDSPANEAHGQLSPVGWGRKSKVDPRGAAYLPSFTFDFRPDTHLAGKHRRCCSET